jgi:Ran GTPase-activating protein (RanGAP) involved in mRNA processing and transport
LVSLDISSNQLRDDGVRLLSEAIGGGGGLSGLKALCVGQNTIGIDGIRSLSSCNVFQQLDVLNLFNNAISPLAAASLAAALSRATCRLSKLLLSGCRLNATAAKALAQCLPDARSLSELVLSHNSIGDDGCAALATSLLKNRKLSNLNISEKYVSMYEWVFQD